MTRDELEFSISQYHDGTLPPLERDRVDEILATDADTRSLLSEYARLDALMRDEAPAVPELDWDRVHARLSRAVANCDDAPAVKTFRIGRLAWIGGAVAAAAAVAIVASITLRDPTGTGGTGPGARPRGEISVAVGPTGPAGGPVAIAVSQQGSPAVTASIGTIAVGPSAEVASGAWRYDDGIVVRPSRILIAGGGSGSGEPVGDGSANPY